MQIKFTIETAINFRSLHNLAATATDFYLLVSIFLKKVRFFVSGFCVLCWNETSNSNIGNSSLWDVYKWNYFYASDEGHSESLEIWANDWSRTLKSLGKWRLNKISGYRIHYNSVSKNQESIRVSYNGY